MKKLVRHETDLPEAKRARSADQSGLLPNDNE
jgi:hypothetical protein